MVSEALPDDLRRFLATHISSVEQLEVLLLLRAAPEDSFTAERISHALRTSPSSIEARLKDLAHRGLAERRGEADGAPTYGISKASPDAAAVDALAGFYATHRVTIIEAIFSRPRHMLQTLADAFRLKERK